MSSILGSERKPNATARCEQLIVDGSLQVAGLYIDGTAAGGGGELADIRTGFDDGIVTYIQATDEFVVDVNASLAVVDLVKIIGDGTSGVVLYNNDESAFQVDEIALATIVDLKDVVVTGNSGSLLFNGNNFEVSTESFFKASGHDAGVIKWIKGNYHGTAMTVTDGQPTLSTGGATTDKYLVEVCAALKVPDTTNVEQLTLLIKQGDVNKGVAYYSGRATTGVVTQNVYCKAVVDGGANNITVVAFQETAAGAAVLVTVDVAGTNVSCRKFR